MANSHIATGPTLASPGRGNLEPERFGPDRLVEGDAVGDYVVEQFLGAGAMGEVYAGRHPVINKRVAIKVLKRELASDKEAAERFVREARAVNQIDHPNVIDVFNFGQLKGDDGRLYLVMDLVDGKSLRKVLEDGPLPVAAALDILEQIADALDTAHARGVVHRDLKPDNVMLTSGAKPKVFVLDFGIAKLFTATATGSGGIGNGTLTGKGTWLGTPGYMAPEQWSAEGAGPASDRYALGVMAYELLSGTLPFKAPTLPQMMEQHFRSPVPALSQRGTAQKSPEHHQTLDPVLARAMAKSPDDRFPTGRALVDALRAASQGHAVEVPAAGGKRSLAMPAVAGASVLALAVIGFLVVRPGDSERDDRDRDRPAATSTERVIKLEVITRPPNAKVHRDGQLLGETPVKVEVPAGAKLTLAISKPGYRPITDTLTADKPLSLVKDLQPVLGFQGVWSMPDGKLRGFWRTGERVEVYRLETVTGDRELWRTCDLVDSPTGSEAVMFATTAEMTDERAHHGEAGCSIPHRIEYKFDPTAETLEVSAEKVETARRDGSCIVVSRAPGAPIKLARADRGTGDTRITQPPVGIPRSKGEQANNVPNDSFDKELDAKTKRLLDSDKTNVAPPPKPVPKQPAPAKPTIKSDLGKPRPFKPTNDDAVQKLAPQAKAPSKNAKEPAIQSSQAPTPQAPAPAQAPGGDSQQTK
ncbi:MAG: serine/threonine protein kinase [Deltaproteobacteria bacterium]|nr:serine/threonine protein kinase [Deltaproteobacteria bacterium]